MGDWPDHTLVYVAARIGRATTLFVPPLKFFISQPLCIYGNTAGRLLPTGFTSIIVAISGRHDKYLIHHIVDPIGHVPRLPSLTIHGKSASHPPHINVGFTNHTWLTQSLTLIHHLLGL